MLCPGRDTFCTAHLPQELSQLSGRPTGPWLRKKQNKKRNVKPSVQVARARCEWAAAGRGPTPSRRTGRGRSPRRAAARSSWRTRRAAPARRRRCARARNVTPTIPHWHKYVGAGKQQAWYFATVYC